MPEHGSSEIILAVAMLAAFALGGVFAERRRARAEAARRSAVDELERAERAKDEFFTLVSHELRTPLTSIRGYLELLLDPADGQQLDASQLRFLSIMERNAKRLERLVGDLLFIAQFEAGRMALDPHSIELDAVLEDAVDAARPRAEELGVELRCDFAELPSCAGDPGRLAQAVDELLSNAIKFTGDGGAVAVRLENRGGHAVIEVEDDGIGIPEEDQERLFDRFYRASTATERHINGMGLGLSVTRAIVEGHGGEISLESRPGAGTTFRVALPLPALVLSTA